MVKYTGKTLFYEIFYANRRVSNTQVLMGRIWSLKKCQSMHFSVQMFFREKAVISASLSNCVSSKNPEFYLIMAYMN